MSEEKRMYVHPTLWALNIVVSLLSMEGQKASIENFIKNILIFVPKMNEGLTSFERHEDD